MTHTEIFAPHARRMAVSGLRQNNERAVMTVVAAAPGSSAAQIARATGLGPQSVSRILIELEAAGLVRRGEAKRGRRGQPAVPIFVDPSGAYCVGCEIGWRHMHILIRNLDGQILGEHRRDYDYPEPSALLNEIISLSRLLVGLVPEEHRSRILGIGLAMPFGIARNVHLVQAPDEVVQRWKQIDIAGEVQAATGLTVQVFNDGNAGCWAELCARPITRPRNIAYLQVGTFVGAGLVENGRLWEGSSGNSANLGSMMVCDLEGQRRYGHLVASLFALENRLRAAGKPVPTGNPADWDWEAIEPEAGLWIEEASLALTQILFNTAAVMEFSVAIVDGVMPRSIVHRLVERVKARVAEHPTLTADRPAVEIGRLGATAPARGAALQPMFRRVFSRDVADFLD